MDPRRFDSLARSLATPRTRRGFFGVVAALAGGALGRRGAAAQVTQAYCGNVSCRNNPGKCKDGCACCEYGNGNSRCMPPASCTGVITSPTTTAAPTTTTTVAPTTTTTTSTTVAPTTTTTTAAPALCTVDGDPCPGGVCFGGVCCDSGADLPSEGDLCDALNGGFCCSDGTICCGSEGCCTDCFIEDSSTPLCCPELSLCPPRSDTNPEPPYCCRSDEICATDQSLIGAGCYIPQYVCNGRYCRGECCGGTTCCEEGTYCSGGSCVPVPSTECVEDTDCGVGLGCVSVVRDEEGTVLQAGDCCPVNRVCDSDLEPGGVPQPDSICCSAGQRCQGPFICCELDGCSPRGGRTRL